MTPRSSLVAAVLAIGVALVGPAAVRAEEPAQPVGRADGTSGQAALDPAPAAPSVLETTDQIIVTTTTAAVSDPQITAGTEAAAADVGVDVSAVNGADVTRTTSVVRLSESLPVDQIQQIADQLAGEPGIASARPDRRVLPAVAPPLPDDAYFSSQWGLWDSATGDGGFSARGPAAWPVTTGTGAVVAVLDTGITNHPDLNSNVIAGYDFIDTLAVANDGNLRDSDPSDPGDWITYAESISYPFSGCSVHNSTWHGTHVAGIIAALSGSTYGVAGIAPTARIQPVRVLGKCGGYDSDILAAVTWASGGHVPGVPDNPTPADVLNLSLGGPSGPNGCAPQDDAIFSAAINRGSVVVVAAGNGNTNANSSWPGNCPSVLTVAATGRAGERAYYSNYNVANPNNPNNVMPVDIAAPGGDSPSDSGIISTLNTGDQSPQNPTWVNYQGTSMAAPFVAGAAALMAAADPTLIPAQITWILKNTAQPFPAGTSSCLGICGDGIVDAGAAIASLAPQDLAVTASVESLTAQWSEPLTGSAVSSYTVDYTTDDSTWISAGSVSGTSTTITGLTSGINYRIRVNCTTASHTCPWSSSALVQPLAPTAPGAPTALDVLTDDSSLQVAWTAPVDNGGRTIDWYAVQHSTDDSTWFDDDTTATASTTIRNLTNGTPYRVRVRAHNAVGYGAWTTAGSMVSPQVLTPPGAPQSLGLSTGDTSVMATWTAPATTGGRPVLWYAVQHSTDDSTWISDDTTAATAATIGGLANGTTYYVRVAAVNAIGQGAWASEHAVTTTPVTPPPPPSGGGAPPPPPPTADPPKQPGAPTITAALPGNAQIALTWQAPDDTGGAAITGYVVRLLGLNRDDTVTVTGTATTVTGLVNGATYAVRVAAINSAGTGAWSAAFNGLIPRTTPDAPTGLRVIAGSGSVALTWSPPAFDGGNDITGYLVSVASKDDTMQFARDDTSFALAGLANGTAYTIRVAALNAAGTGAWTTPTTVTPMQSGVTAPVAVSAIRKGRTVRVRWQAPLQGTPQRYLVSASINGRSWQLVGDPTARSQSFTVPRATLRVAVKVAAVDSKGRGPWSVVISV